MSQPQTTNNMISFEDDAVQADFPLISKEESTSIFKLMADLKVDNVQLLVHYIYDLQKHFDDQKEQILEYNNLLDVAKKLNAEKQTLEKQNSQLIEQNQVLESELRSAQSQISDVKSKVDMLGRAEHGNVKTRFSTDYGQSNLEFHPAYLKSNQIDDLLKLADKGRQGVETVTNSNQRLAEMSLQYFGTQQSKSGGQQRHQLPYQPHKQTAQIEHRPSQSTEHHRGQFPPMPNGGRLPPPPSRT